MNNPLPADQSTNALDGLLNNEFTPGQSELATLQSLEGSTVILESLDINMASVIPGQQYLHGYKLEETHGFNQAIQNTADRFYNHSMQNGSAPSPLAHKVEIASALAHGLTYVPDRSPIIMPDTWQDPNRGTFVLRCTLQSAGRNIPLLVRGFTNANSPVSNGRHGYSLPQDTIFRVNDVCELRNVGGVERYVNVTKELRPPNGYRDGFTGNGDNYATIGSEDVLRHVAVSGMIQSEYDVASTANLTGALVSPTGSSVTGNSPVSWVTEIVSDYNQTVQDMFLHQGGNVTDAAVQRHILTYGTESPSGMATKSSNEIIYQFLSFISTGGDTQYYDLEFNMRSLLALDASIDDRTDIAVLGTNAAASGTVFDEYGRSANPFNLAGFDSTSAGTSESLVGNMIAQTLDSVLQRASITALTDASITNRTMDGLLEVLMPSVGIASNNDMVIQQTVDASVRALKVELGVMLQMYGAVTISKICYYPPNVITMNIQIGDGVVTPFAAPLWANSMTAPVIQNADQRAVVNGNEFGDTHYQSTMDALSTTISALSTLRA